MFTDIENKPIPGVFKLGQNIISISGDRTLFEWYLPDFLDPAQLFLAPVFEVNGQVRDNFVFLAPTQALSIAESGASELSLEYISHGAPDLYLRVTLRGFSGSPFVRMRYRLSAQAPCQMTKSSGKDQIQYFSSTFAAADLTEISLSQFEPVLHAYLPNFERFSLDDAAAGAGLAGPILILEAGNVSYLLAYEHGTDAPDSFLYFDVAANGQVTLLARKGNYYAGQPLGVDQAWESVWFELGMQAGGTEELLSRYRGFILSEMSPASATREPVICYNTWNYQERNHLYRERPYLESMNLERMLAEIDVAQRMGIDIFVVDAGWFVRPGDWEVNLERFPDGLREVKRKLDGYGMQLGLWFNPLAAGVASRIYTMHPEYEMSRDGQTPNHWVVWETELSAAMCLASDFADHFVEVMLRFRETLGVTYFKWDGIDQFGCDSPLHQHGDRDNPAEERADCYAYRMGNAMIRMIEQVTRRYPEVIVDFDATECGRFVGLGLLSAARLFLINNGSYAKDFDTPASSGITPWMNMFFYAGAARARVCRRASLYDMILPAQLLLTHFLPDGPAISMRNNLASLVLGGNGLWGDLPALKKEEVAFWADNLADYKRVARAAGQAYPRERGFIGSSPEIHEKIDPQTASGLVSFFTVKEGRFVYLTQPVVLERLEDVKGADEWQVMGDGRLSITVQLGRDDARTVFIFGKE